MSHRYAPIPNPGHGNPSFQYEREAEMEAAFDGPDDEDDNATESQPLNPQFSSPRTPTPQNSGIYNFENVDYDYPPPGSPPPPSAIALPNNIGNTNGFIPTFAPHTPNRPHRMWFQRAATAVLPSSVSARIGLTPRRPTGPVGGGTNNDGVFANVTAKPTAPLRVQDGLFLFYLFFVKTNFGT